MTPLRRSNPSGASAGPAPSRRLPGGEVVARPTTPRSRRSPERRRRPDLPRPQPLGSKPWAPYHASTTC